MKNIFRATKDSVTQNQTLNRDAAATARRDVAEDMVEPGDSGLITQLGKTTQNENAKGFAFEHRQVEDFNHNARLAGEPYEAIRVPPGGAEKINEEYGLDPKLSIDRSGEPDIIIINRDTGELLQTVQAKCGQERTINQAIHDEKYETTDMFVVNSENEHIAEQHDNVSTTLEYGGVTSNPVSEEEAIAIANDPEGASQDIVFDANKEEVCGGAVAGAAIGGGLALVQSSIKILAKAYRGEPVGKETLLKALKDVFEGIKTGVCRGALVKILQRIIDSSATGSALPVVIVAVGMEVFPVMLRYFKDEITFETMLSQCGAKALSSAIIVVICIAYPPTGFALLGFSVINTIWQEFKLRELLGRNTSIDHCLCEVESSITATKEKSQKVARAAKDATINTAKATLETTAHVAGTAKDATLNAAETTIGFTVHMADSAKNATINAAEATKDFTANVAETAKNATLSAAGTTIDFTAHMADTAKCTTINATEATRDFTANVAETVRDTTMSATETTIDLTAHMADTAKNATINAAEVTKDFTVNVAETAKDATLNAAEAIKASADSLKQRFSRKFFS